MKPDLYNSDVKASRETSMRLEKETADLAFAKEEWLRLEMLREELEGGKD